MFRKPLLTPLLTTDEALAHHLWLSFGRGEGTDVLYCGRAGRTLAARGGRGAEDQILKGFCSLKGFALNT